MAPLNRLPFARQVFFFVLAVLLPSAALVLFGAGFLAQERQLADGRKAAERAAFARDTGRFLEDRLREVTTDATLKRSAGADSLRHPAGFGVLWLGTYDGTRFTPAWLHLRRPEPLSWEPNESAAEEAERLEFRDRNYAAAAERWLRLGRQAHDVRQKTVARLRGARALTKAGDLRAALGHAKGVLSADFAIQDENGVPIAYYAADLLLTTGADSLRARVRSRLSAEADDPRWFRPVRTYMLRDLLRVAGDTALIAGSVPDAEYVERLREDIPSLMRAGAGDRWIRYGDRLLGAGTPGPEGRRDIYAITVESLALLAADQDRVLAVHLEGEQPPDALALRPYLRDAYVTLGPATGAAASVPRAFYVLGLGLLVGLTLFGGYLLWRDVRRESRLAQLRAQFVSSVSHELRTPLTSIRMFAETMMLDDDAPTDVRRRYLGVISNESERLTRMLNNVLSASRIEQGTSTYHRVTTDVRESVQAAVSAMRFAFEQQGVTLTATIPDAPMIASVDPDAIEQAVLNLLTNALKYGAGSPVGLALSTGTDGTIRVLVTDRGPGIPSNERALIFDRFYRSQTAQHQRVAGAGLGLSLVKHIAEAHGGHVSVESTVGEGSAFRIHIPSMS